MKITTVIKETWLTRPPSPNAGVLTLLLALLLLLCSVSVFTGQFHAQELLPATAEAVFQKHQIWRLWTSLFVHGDLGHLLSNSFLFFPLAFLLTSYFSFWFFPLIGIFLGGFINLMVLKTLPDQVSLIGISGVVYWMAAAWLTLYILIDRRHSLKKRFAISIFLTAVLLAPETYKPDISYLSHLLGYVSGILSAVTLYLLNRRQILSSEVVEYHIEDESDLDWLPDSTFDQIKTK